MIMLSETPFETTGVRALAFHPDGRCLFSALQDGMRVWQWEPPPALQLDNVDVPWSKVGICLSKMLSSECVISVENSSLAQSATGQSLQITGKSLPPLLTSACAAVHVNANPLSSSISLSTLPGGGHCSDERQEQAGGLLLQPKLRGAVGGGPQRGEDGLDALMLFSLCV